MASKKKSPSFEIPAAVRQAGQSGWVYRTDAAKGKPRREASKRPAPTPAAAPAREVAPRMAVHLSAPVEPEPQATVPPDKVQDAWTVSTGVIGLGLHVAAVPLVMPLYVTAAISRKLGLLPR